MAREFSKSFYNSTEWKNVREYVWKRDHGLCVKCGRPGEEVHHIKHITPRNIDDPRITLDESNLALLCRDCHFAIHREDIQRNTARANKRRVHEKIVNDDGYYFDDDGNLVKRKVHIVYGAPRSGKTTYIKSHMLEGDCVIDTDAILAALHLDDTRHKDQNLLFVAEDIRKFLFDIIADEQRIKSFNCRNIWIVGGFPLRSDRNDLADRLGADLIFIESTQYECEERAKQNNLYDGDIQYAVDIVNEYFRKLER